MVKKRKEKNELKKLIIIATATTIEIIIRIVTTEMYRWKCTRFRIKKLNCIIVLPNKRIIRTRHIQFHRYSFFIFYLYFPTKCFSVQFYLYISSISIPDVIYYVERSNRGINVLKKKKLLFLFCFGFFRLYSERYLAQLSSVPC